MNFFKNLIALIVFSIYFCFSSFHYLWNSNN